MADDFTDEKSCFVRFHRQNDEMALQTDLDDLDQKLLAALAANSAISVSQLARRFRVARSTVQARVERLERTGIIAGYTIKLGQAVTLRRIKATVLMQIESRAAPQVLQRLKAMPSTGRPSRSTAAWTDSRR